MVANAKRVHVHRVFGCIAILATTLLDTAREIPYYKRSEEKERRTGERFVSNTIIVL